MENKTVVGSIGIKRIGIPTIAQLCQCATFLVPFRADRQGEVPMLSSQAINYRFS